MHLSLDFDISPPSVLFTLNKIRGADPQASVARIGVEVAHPQLPYADARFDAVVAPDVIEHVLDEEHWLAELARITRPGGRLAMSVPASGPLAWLDALNLYRYLVETTHRGTAPRQTLPIGWHRHYRRSDLAALLSGAGFEPIRIHRVGTGLAEAPSLAGQITLDWLLGLPNAEQRIRRARAPLDRLDRRLRTGPFGTWLIAEAVRP